VNWRMVRGARCYSSGREAMRTECAWLVALCVSQCMVDGTLKREMKE